MSSTGILVGAGLLALAGRKAKTTSGETLEEMVARVAQANGAPSVVMLAFVDTENGRWDARAVNMGPGDDRRGGAWGLPQITLRTARDVDDQSPSRWAELDPTRSGPTLLAHPDLAVELAAKLVAELHERAGTVEDVASLYNSGRRYENAPAVTRDVYVPRFMRNYRRRMGVA